MYAENEMLPFFVRKYDYVQNVLCKIYDQHLIALMCYILFTFLRLVNTQTGWQAMGEGGVRSC